MAADQLTPAQKTELRTQADAYLTSFNALVELDQEIIVHNEEMLAAAGAVEPLVVKLEALGEQLAADGAQHRTHKQHSNLYLFHHHNLSRADYFRRAGNYPLTANYQPDPRIDQHRA